MRAYRHAYYIRCQRKQQQQSALATKINAMLFLVKKTMLTSSAVAISNNNNTDDNARKKHTYHAHMHSITHSGNGSKQRGIDLCDDTAARKVVRLYTHQVVHYWPCRYSHCVYIHCRLQFAHICRNISVYQVVHLSQERLHSRNSL